MPDNRVEIMLTTENTPSGRRVRRTPSQLTTSVAQANIVRITNGNAESATGGITLVLDRTQTGRTIAATGLPPALLNLASLPPAATAGAAPVASIKIPLAPGASIEWHIKPVAAGTHSGFSVNTEPARIDNPDHVDYHWDC